DEGSVIVVGENTAGRTGFYEEIQSGDWKIHGELRPGPNHSLVPAGIKPRISVALSPEAQDRGYFLYEAGTKIEPLVRQPERATAAVEDAPDESEKVEESAGTDPILQRGLEIVAALQVLQQLPDT